MLSYPSPLQKGGGEETEKCRQEPTNHEPLCPQFHQSAHPAANFPVVEGEGESPTPPSSVGLQTGQPVEVLVPEVEDSTAPVTREWDAQRSEQVEKEDGIGS